MNGRPTPATSPAAPLASRLRFLWPSAAGVALFLAALTWMIRSAMSRNAGTWVYPVDDIYIHMAAVKQLIRHGVWGISYVDGFSSCVSSLLYPFLIGFCYALSGVNESAPFILNAIASAGAVVYAGILLQRVTRSGVFTLIVLAAAVFLTPLAAVALTGMEHTWQTLLDLFLIDMAVRTLVRDGTEKATRRSDFLLLLAACLAVMIRFEGFFIVAIVGLLLLCRRRFWLAVAVGAAAALPVVIFGVYSLRHGWDFLPNSVVVKSGLHTRDIVQETRAMAALLGKPREFIDRAYTVTWPTLQKYAHMFALLTMLGAALYWLVRRHRTLWTRPAVLLCIVLVTTVQHLGFASIGLAYRYEAYLVFLGVVALGLAVADIHGATGGAWLRREVPLSAAVWLFVVAALFAPLWTRASKSFKFIPQASHNVYEQQYQMGRFVERFYNGEGVAANDIGVISYRADLRVLDTWGLADYDVSQARRRHAYDQDTLRPLLKKFGVRMIVVYDSWATNDFGGPLPEWVLVGQWTILNNVICGDTTVSFYAPTAADVPRLTRALQEFAPELPVSVKQLGAYRGGTAPLVLGAYTPVFNAGIWSYPSPQTIQFSVKPLLYRAPTLAVAAGDVLTVDLLPTAQLQSVDLLVNGTVVATSATVAGHPGQWTPLTALVHWRVGENIVEINGHGLAPYGERMREALFTVHSPSWTPVAESASR